MARVPSVIIERVPKELIDTGSELSFAYFFNLDRGVVRHHAQEADSIRGQLHPSPMEQSSSELAHQNFSLKSSLLGPPAAHSNASPEGVSGLQIYVVRTHPGDVVPEVVRPNSLANDLEP